MEITPDIGAPASRPAQVSHWSALHRPVLSAALTLSLAAAAVAQENPAPTPTPAPNPAVPAAPPATPAITPEEARAAISAVGDKAPDALTLDQAVEYAIRNNPRIAGAAAQVRAARAVITQRRAVRLPQGGVSGTAGLQGPEVGAVAPGGNPIVPAFGYSFGPSVTQIILDFGQRANRQRAAERDTEAARFNQAETQNNVHFVVASAFYDVLRGRELQAVAEENRAAAAEHLRVSQARFAADVAPRFDVLRNQAELADAEQQLVSARNQTAQAEAAFNVALGRSADAPVRIQYAVGPLRPDVPFDRARDAANANRPQLASIRQTIEAGRYEVRARRAENKPQVFAQGGLDIITPTGTTGNDYRYNVGVGLTFPFLDSGLTRGRVREAQALVDVDRANLETARQQAELDIRQAQESIASARERLRSAGVEVVSAREALRVAQVRYSAGVGTNVEVTDAQQALALAGQNLANAQFDYETAEERLGFATGTTLDSLTSGGPLTPRASAVAPPVNAPKR